MRITIVTAIWKRPEINQIFYRSIDALRKNHRIELVVGRSEGETLPNYALAFDSPNHDLTGKWNGAALRSKDTTPDYVIFVGSDDILSESILEEYIKRAEKGIDYIYSTDWYFLDMPSKMGLYWAGYNKNFNRGDACGAGRMFSKRLMNLIGWRPWSNGYDHVLDTGMDHKLRQFDFTREGFSLKDTNSFALDLKSEQNMTPFERWDNSSYIKIQEMKGYIKYYLPEIYEDIYYR